MNEHLTYKAAGVDTDQQDKIMPGLTHWIERTFENRPNTVKLPLGYFANVIDVGNGVGLALSTDGVGTKILVAELLHKYDTIGIDCVAMNVNDVLCVGATPLAMLDYLAVEVPHDDLMAPLIQGLHRGADIAKITIPGGEIAQMGEVVRGLKPGYGCDLVGTCVGRVDLDNILTGRYTKGGDIVVGLRSTGVHSNGLSLARRVFFKHLKWDPGKSVPELGRSLGEELLEPTRIYVREVLEMLERQLKIKALAHITSSGFLNLSRADADVTYVLDSLPEPNPIFRLIQHHGGVTDEEMFFTYNMGIGFCVIVSPEDVDAVRSIARSHGVESEVIGRTVNDPRKEVRLPQYGLVGSGGRFHRS
jgi:phosphoribosylformylglycinamidine cyclo-ligase